jgi:16S rRNA (cytosine967-C5)-methyltransferase
MNNPRIIIAAILRAVIVDQISLDAAFTQQLPAQTQQTSFIKASCFGVLRHYLRLRWYLQQLLEKPLKQKDMDVHCLLLSGLHELFEMHTPDHAVVSESVNAVNQLNKSWAKGLVNAILRNAKRQQTQLQARALEDPEARYLHPYWLLQQLQHDWPDDWQPLVTQNNLPPPMTLRIDTRQIDRQRYLEQLEQHALPATADAHVPCALTLMTAVDVHQLPGFAQGIVSVQDAAAQLAAILLDPQAGERVLDACAAPGGKTLHLLQQQPALTTVLALDNDSQRLTRVQQNLERAGVSAQIQQGDARQPQDWWDGQPFDRILLDAPCSATGVIRRHPDIKMLRRPEDLPRLAQTQAQILDALWPLLKTGGMLLYATCSVLKIENDQQIHNFLALHPDARCQPIDTGWGHAQTCGRQLLPGEGGMDGFYYALIYKQG